MTLKSVLTSIAITTTAMVSIGIHSPASALPRIVCDRTKDECGMTAGDRYMQCFRTPLNFNRLCYDGVRSILTEIISDWKYDPEQAKCAARISRHGEPTADTMAYVEAKFRQLLISPDGNMGYPNPANANFNEYHMYRELMTTYCWKLEYNP